LSTRSTNPSSTLRVARKSTVLSERPNSRAISVGVTGCRPPTIETNAKSSGVIPVPSHATSTS
jgi:hypothetical protein